MTPAEHAQQKAWVLASERLQTSRAQRHGVYAVRGIPTCQQVESDAQITVGPAVLATPRARHQGGTP